MNRHEVTLPIEVDDGLRLDAKESRALGSLLHADYVQATPFPHIVFDGFFPESILKLACSNFPAEALKSDRVFDINYGGHHKRQILPYDCSAQAQAIFHFMNSQAVLQFLEGLSGIDGLISDPYFEGGGYHEIDQGGLLGVHADFRINNKLHLQRRLNLLVYLNPDWDERWGGQLELWDRSMKRCEASIFPILNRCVVFSTDADSFHGHPDALRTPDGVKRRSMALYYYTGSRQIYAEVPNRDTMYYARPNDGANTQREARQFRADQYLTDWLPPKLARLFFRARQKIRAGLSTGHA